MNVNRNPNYKKKLSNTNKTNQGQKSKRQSEGNIEKYIEITWKIRDGLFKYGKIIADENPDNLPLNELVALTIKILKEIDNIDVVFGYPPHPIDTPDIAKTVDDSRLEELYADFLDWYEIMPSLSTAIIDHVLENYPREKYNNILCVGDGIKSHLGRKLAMKGYSVISIDPEADTTLPPDEETLKAGGRFIASKDFFTHNSHQAINWANLIVGCKVPTIAEEILKVGSIPAVFTISGNPEMYHMTFKGIPIKSEKQFAKLISQSKGVKVKEYVYDADTEYSITVFEKGTFERAKPQGDTFDDHDSR